MQSRLVNTSIIDSIVDQVLPVSEDVEYLKKNMNYCDHCGADSYAQVIYLNSHERPFIYGRLITAKEVFEEEMIVGKKNNLSEFLKRHKPKDFKDCVFLMPIFMWQKELRIDDPFAPSFAPDPVLDELLKDSRGYLLWIHQFQAYLKVLFGNKLGDFASSLNESDIVKIYQFGDLADFCRANGKDVSKVLNERLLFERLRAPMMQGALKLYNVLFPAIEVKANSGVPLHE